MNRKDLFPIAKNTFQEVTNESVDLVAAGLTYYIFLSLFPLLILALTLLTLFVDQNTAIQYIFTEVAKVIPGAQSLTGLLEDVVTGAFKNRSGVLLVSIVILFYSSSNAFGVLDKAINRAWDIYKTPNIIIVKITSFLMMLIFGVLLLFSAILSIVLSFLRDWSASQGVDLSWTITLWSLLDIVASFGLVFLILVLMYRFVPRVPVLFRDVWLAALLGTVAWVVVKVGFSIYLSMFARYDQVYGTLGTVVALLFWIYISCMIILVGAEFSSQTNKLRILHIEEAQKQAQQSKKKRIEKSPWFYSA